MDAASETLFRYRKIVCDLIVEYSKYRPAVGETTSEPIFDEKNDHYVLMHAGWHGYRRIHNSVIHVDIRAGKIWIQFDGTEDGIAEELVKAGIPRDHIVLAFKPPDVRKHTDYAVT